MKDLKGYLKNFKGEKKLMTIYPHPDDETMAAGGLLMEAKKEGFETIVACLTKGEAGKCFVKKKDRDLKDIRTRELQNAIAILGVDHLELADFGDGKLRGGEKNWVPWVEVIIKKYNPGIVVTYDHSGLYGHPDHIALSLKVTHPVLFWSTFDKKNAESAEMTKDVREFISEPDYFLKVDSFRKWKAAKAHASQKFGENWPPLFWKIFMRKYEWYTLVNPDKIYPFKYLERTF